MFEKIDPTKREIALDLPGDTIVPSAAVVMDRAFTLHAGPNDVWPWLVQLGKNRAGWYFRRGLQNLIFKKSRGIWEIDPKLQSLKVGDVIDDWGGNDATFEAVIVDKNKAIVYKSTRGTSEISWAIVLHSLSEDKVRVQFRLRISSIKFRWFAKSVGGMFDALTIAVLHLGLQQRLNDPTTNN